MIRPRMQPCQLVCRVIFEGQLKQWMKKRVRYANTRRQEDSDAGAGLSWHRFCCLDGLRVGFTTLIGQCMTLWHIVRHGLGAWHAQMVSHALKLLGIEGQGLVNVCVSKKRISALATRMHLCLKLFRRANTDSG